MDLGPALGICDENTLHLVLTLAQNKISHTHFNSAALFEGSPRKSVHYETACSIESSFSESSIYRVKTEGKFKSAH